MEQKTYLFDFSIGGVMCRLAAATGEYTPEYSVTYYHHSHAFHEIHYVRKGKFLCKVEDTKYELSAGQLILIRAGCYHSVTHLTDEWSKMCVGFDVYRNNFKKSQKEEKEFADVFYREKAVVLDTNKVSSGAMIVSILDQISEMYKKQDLDMLDREELKSLTTLLLLKLNKEIGQTEHADEPDLMEMENNRDFWIDEFFNLNFNRNDGYELLAKQINVSTRQLDRILQKNYGMGYQKKLMEIRLKIAKDLLQTTDKSVAEISELLGYGSASSFCSFIKRETNLSPVQIRKGKLV